jgi:mRNA interferase RelE/StbE
MKYRVSYTDTAIEDMRKLDRSVRVRIAKWVMKHLDGAEFPMAHGKPMTGNYKGFWRYRVGDYRLIAEIFDDLVAVSVVAVGHRRDIYKVRLGKSRS